MVPREKFDKLEGVIRKIYSQIGLIKEEGLWMPIDPDNQKTMGFCFIEYNTPQVPSFLTLCTYLQEYKEFEINFFCLIFLMFWFLI